MRTLGRFLADFVIGDDWRIAAGVASVVGVCALLVAATGLGAQPIAVVAVVGFVATAAGSLRV
jgi:hypothetical protein